MKKTLLMLAAALCLSFGAQAQVYSTTFPGTTLPAGWGPTPASSTYSLAANNGLTVTMLDSVGPQQPSGPGANYSNFYYAVAVANAFNMAQGCKCVSFDIDNTGNQEITLYIQAGDKDQNVGGVTDHYTNNTKAIIAAGYVGNVTVNFAGKFKNNATLLDSTKIKSFDFQPLGKELSATPWNKKFKGTLKITNFKVSAPLTGVNEAQANISSSKLYPNPVSDVATVELNLKSASNVKVTLSDAMGKEVMTIANGTMASLNESFSVSNLKAGIYTVNYFIEGSAAKSELLMVK